MTGVLYPTLAVAALLVLVSGTVPLAERLRVPHTALLALLGIIVGYVLLLFQSGESPAVGRELLQGLGDLGIDPSAFLTIFLPPLLFVGGLSIDVRRLFDEIGAVLLLAIVAVIVCTAVVGYALAWITDHSLVACLLLGAIIATTDPSAVVAIFRDLGAPRRLQMLIESESLFNDAAAIALFSMLVGFLTAERQPEISAAVLDFLSDFGGGLLLGYLLARAMCALAPWLQGSLVAEMTLTIALAYLAYAVGETWLGVSGVVAVVTASVTSAAYGPLRMAPRNWRSILETWGQVGFLASSLIIVLAAMLATRIVSEVTLSDALMVLVVVATALAARAAILYGLFPVLRALRLTSPVSHRYRAVILWGGLRGAVTIVLALAISENRALPPEVRHFVAVQAIGFVLFTLFVKAPTLRSLLRFLGLDALDPVERALRDRVVDLSRAAMREHLTQIAEQYRLDPGIAARLLPRPRTGTAAAPPVPADVALRVGLLTLAGREKELYLRHFDEGTVSRRLVAMLVAFADRLADRTRAEGAEGYAAAGTETASFGRRFTLALWLHRRLGFGRPLAYCLADRFEVLLIQQLVVRELATMTREAVGPILGADVERAIGRVVTERLEAIRNALSALELQYPAYAQEMGAQHLARTMLRVEAVDYRQKLDQSLISREVYRDLQRGLNERRRSLEQRPVLDLGLKLMDMVRRVGMFADLDGDRLQSIARKLKPMLVTPGEAIVRRGEAGSDMYFVAAGEVEVRVEGGPVILRSGDFFGELALLRGQPRTADVIAKGYCHLLVLESREYRRFLREYPDLRAEIEKTATARMQSNAASAAMD